MRSYSNWISIQTNVGAPQLRHHQISSGPTANSDVVNMSLSWLYKKANCVEKLANGQRGEDKINENQEILQEELNF